MNPRKAVIPILVLFGAVAIGTMATASWLAVVGIDADVLMMANLFVCLLTLFSFWMLFRGLRAKSTTSFLTAVYGSFLAKLLLAALAVVIYATVSGEQMNKPAVFGAMMLYLCYMFLEIRALLLLVKKK
jgi:hypothetical protein